MSKNNIFINKTVQYLTFIYKWMIRMLIISFIIAIFSVVSIYYSDYHIKKSCEERCFSDINQVPAKKVGLVLGASPHIGSHANPFFTARINAAASLYRAGKVQFLLVSGDNGQNYYDEVTSMEQALIAQGVPAQRIYKDHAGFRTLDSMIRAHKVFGEDDVIVISQAFHNARALYLGDHHGLEKSVAFNAADVEGYLGQRVLAREKLARLKAVLDINLFNRGPRFLGDKILIK